MITSREYAEDRVEYIGHIFNTLNADNFESDIEKPVTMFSHCDACQICIDFINQIERMSSKEFAKLVALTDTHPHNTVYDIVEIYLSMGNYIFIRDVCDSDDLSGYFYEMFPLLCPNAMETHDFKEIIRNGLVAHFIEAEHEITYHELGCLIKVDSHNAYNPIIRILFDQ